MVTLGGRFGQVVTSARHHRLVGPRVAGWVGHVGVASRDLVGLLTVGTVSVSAGQAGGPMLAKEVSVRARPAGAPTVVGSSSYELAP